MAQILKTQALVLSSIRWQDTSKIVTLFSRQQGVLKVIARGAYRKDSPFGGTLESLNYGTVIIDSKESRSIQILRDIDILNAFPALKNDFEKYPYALTVIEIINQVFVDFHSDEVFFDFTVFILEVLEKTENSVDVLIYFLLKLVSFLGFKPELQTCHSGDLTKCADVVGLNQSNGTISCENCSGGSVQNFLLKKEQFFYLKHLQILNHRRLSDFRKNMKDTKPIIWLIIDYLNYHLENNLKLNSLSLI